MRSPDRQQSGRDLKSSGPNTATNRQYGDPKEESGSPELQSGGSLISSYCPYPGSLFMSLRVTLQTVAWETGINTLDGAVWRVLRAFTWVQLISSGCSKEFQDKSKWYKLGWLLIRRKGIYVFWIASERSIPQCVIKHGKWFGGFGSYTI